MALAQVVVDEIHERDSFADFLLIILRDVLPQHPQLRVVLMSATLHIDLFSSYFGMCPVIQVHCPALNVLLSRPSASACLYTVHLGFLLWTAQDVVISQFLSHSRIASGPLSLPCSAPRHAC